MTNNLLRYTILIWGCILSENKDLIKTSINLPSKVYKRIESFADDVCINRNSAMIYLLARGLEYEYDFENYMQRKRKKKLDNGYVQDSVENSIKKRMNDKARQRLEHNEMRLVLSEIERDSDFRKVIIDYVEKLLEDRKNG